MGRVFMDVFKLRKRLLLSLFVLTILISAAAFYYYTYQKRIIRENQEKLFISVSKSKLEQIVNWRRERLMDAHDILYSGAIKARIERYLNNKNDSRLRNELRAWFSSLIKNDKYNRVILLDDRFNLALSTEPDTVAPGKYTLKNAHKAFDSGKIIFTDFHFNKYRDKVFIDLVVPLQLENGLKIGTLILRIDPGITLYPLLKSWFVQNKTVETLLIERDKDSLIYLNELRFRKNTALRLKYPVQASDLPAAKTIRGETGIIYGKDYRGAGVIAYSQNIPGTPWYILSKIDTSELYEGLSERVIYILIIAILLVLSGSAAVWRFVKGKLEQHYKTLYQIERDKKVLQQQNELLAKYANDMIFLMDEDRNIKYVNDKVIDTYGYEPEEILKMKVTDITESVKDSDIPELRQKIESRNGFIFEDIHKKKNGEMFPVEVSSRMIDIDGEKYYQSIVRDISERKAAEEKIYQLNRVYVVLSNTNQMLVRANDKAALLDEACRIAVRDGGFKLVWVGMIDEDMNNVSVVSKAGNYEDYLKNFKVNLNDTSVNCGPTGLCIKTGEYVCCNDIENDPRMKPWHASAKNNNFKASATFPLKYRYTTIGTINFYADQKNFFTEEEIKLLNEMAGDISYAIEFLDTEEKRKKYEEDLTLSEERYKELFEHNPNPMLIYEAGTWNFIDINKTAVKHYGYSREEFLSMNLMEILPEEDIPLTLRLIEDTESEVRNSGVWRHKIKNGSYIYVDIKSNNLPSPGSKKYRIVLVNDVTDKMKIEEEMRKSEERYRLISTVSSDYMFSSMIKDNDELYLNWVAGAFERITGYTYEEYIAAGGWRAALYPEDKPVDDNDMKQLAANRDAVTEVRTIHKNGSIVWVRVYAHPVWDDNKNGLVGIYGAVQDISERKAAEIELRQSEARLQKAQQVAHVGFLDWDLKTNLIFLSDEVFSLFGLEKSNTLSTPELLIKAVYPDDLEFVRHNLEMAISGDRKYNIDHRIKRPDGNIIWVHATAELISENGGVPKTLLGTVIDVTARKKIEETLRESEERYRNLIEVIPYGIAVHQGGKIVFSNPAGATLLGLNSTDDIIGLPIDKIVHPDYLERAKDRIKRTLMGEKGLYPTDDCYVKADGTPIFVDVIGSSILFKNKPAIQVIISDITKRKTADEELKKLYFAIEQSPASIVITDINGYIEYVNTMFTRISGYTFEEVKGKQSRILRADVKTREELDGIFNILYDGVQWKDEFYNKNKAGNYYWEECSISPIKNKEGIITNLLIIQEDITEKKRTVEELIVAKEKAVEANKAKDVFLANMSHELRTPLIGILGYSELLTEELKDPEKIEMSTGIKRAGKRLLNTLNLILDLTRIESNKFEISLEHVNIINEIQSVFNSFKGAALEKKLDFILNVPDDNLTAEIDKNVFSIVMENLINNAIKFTKQGNITVSAGRENKDIIFISVKDTGIGIDEKHFNIVFEEFRQVSEGINREFQGTGLGLSITKRYVEMLGGTISIESKVGAGSAFIIRLPAA